MKPKPLVALNHLTVPVDICNFSKMRTCAHACTNLRAGLIRFQRCLGEKSRFGAFNKQIDYSNGRRLRPPTGNSKPNRYDMTNTDETTAARSAEPAELLLGYDALDVLGLALDAVARAAVGLDR